MAMTLARLCASCPGLQLTGDAQTAISTVTVDSRRAGPGALFVAVQGAAADGHAFVADAVAAGCAAVAVDAARLPGLGLDPAAGRPVAIVAATGTARLPALLARELHGRPDEQLVVAGITGTNGKTTVAFLLRALLGTLRGPCGLLGTVRYETGQTTRPAPLTTPDGPTLFALLAEMTGAGARAAAMELSSHALDQGRAAGLALDVAVLTNLGRDHLDYHADLAAYLAAKTRIVDLLRDSPRTKGPGALVYNAAEPAFGGLTAANAGLRVVRFDAGDGAADGTAEVRVVRRELSASGTQLTIDCFDERLELASPLVGRFNVENLAAALAAGVALGLPAAACAAALAGAEQVPGRLERIALPTGAVAIVDYAHTPDALAAAATVGRELAAGRLLLVFGCGGDRDRGKRPLMGAVAAREADAVWITSDNPRGEEPDAICRAIRAGFDAVTAPRAGACTVVIDRTAAIGAALAAARDGDVVLVAGKGHEDYQLIGKRRLDLDDRRLVRDWIAREGRDG
jgi:UDP-N-acetylmuramoyl-L-alanyl-D-glutamate--2,6-diaminopimelate ligase